MLHLGLLRQLSEQKIEVLLERRKDPALAFKPLYWPPQVLRHVLRRSRLHRLVWWYLPLANVVCHRLASFLRVARRWNMLYQCPLHLTDTGRRPGVSCRRTAL